MMKAMTIEATHEYIVAAEAFAESLSTWARVHLAWSKGEVGIEEDREAYADREAKFAEFKRIEASLKAPADEREQDQAYVAGQGRVGAGCRG